MGEKSTESSNKIDVIWRTFRLRLNYSFIDSFIKIEMFGRKLKWNEEIFFSLKERGGINADSYTKRLLILHIPSYIFALQSQKLDKIFIKNYCIFVWRKFNKRIPQNIFHSYNSLSTSLLYCSTHRLHILHRLRPIVPILMILLVSMLPNALIFNLKY